MTGTEAVSCGRWGGWKVEVLGTVLLCLRHKVHFHDLNGKRSWKFIWGHWTRQHNWEVHGEFYFDLVIGFILHIFTFANIIPPLSHSYYAHCGQQAADDKLTSRIRVILRSWQFLSWSRNFPHFEENAGSVLYSIQPANYSYPDPKMNTVCTLPHFFFKTFDKHWWIQVDWKHWINLFFPSIESESAHEPSGQISLRYLPSPDVSHISYPTK
jgi:hypothetical protein